MLSIGCMEQSNGKNKHYNLVSLGYFCAVAMEMEKSGLRNCSLPFDWIISGDFSSVLELIRNGFDGFLKKETLYQEFDINPSYYYNPKSKVHFYHDFVSWKSLDSQYDAFVEKYERRIKRFYHMIRQPTVFIRYCQGEKEIHFVMEHREEIDSFLKSFHPDNRIIYLSDVAEVKNRAGFIWVEPDKENGVSDHFLDKVPQLRNQLIQLSGLSNMEMQQNILRRRIKKLWKFRKKIARRLNKIIGRVYVHSLQYGDIVEKIKIC